MLELHYWLENFFPELPNSPKCDEPKNLAGEEIKSLGRNEFACKPEVSPTSMFLEVVVGKNMSLICNVEVTTILYKKLFLIIRTKTGIFFQNLSNILRSSVIYKL